MKQLQGFFEVFCLVKPLIQGDHTTISPFSTVTLTASYYNELKMSDRNNFAPEEDEVSQLSILNLYFENDGHVLSLILKTRTAVNSS